jgi:hypothetical protein
VLLSRIKRVQLDDKENGNFVQHTVVNVGNYGKVVFATTATMMTTKLAMVLTKINRP